MTTQSTKKSLWKQAVAVFMVAMLLLAVIPATSASAAISKPSNWTSQYASATYPSGVVNAAYTIAAGSGRLLVVAIASTRTTAGNQTVSNVTYGGQALTLAAGDGASTGTWNHSYLYYLNEAGIQAASGTSLNVTITGGTSFYNWVYAAVYAGVNQTTPITDAKNYNSGATADTAVGPFSPTLTINANDQAIEVINLARNSTGNTVRSISTFATGWATAGIDQTFGGNGTQKPHLYIRDRNVLTAASDGSQHTADNAGTWDSMTAMSIKPKVDPTLSVTNSPVTYNGSPQAATVTGSVPGTVSNVKYGGSSTVPTNAGTYAITADFTPTDTAAYNSLTGASAGNFVINKATPTLSVTNSPVTYDGAAHSATVTGSVAGVVSNILTGGTATKTNAGTYAVTANFAPTDTTNYNSLTGGAAGNFIINKATPTLSVTNSPVTYNGAAHAATVSGSVAGVASSILTGGSATQTNAGTYAVTANFTPTDTTNYNSLTGASAGNFIINKATPTLSVTNSPVTYDGAVHSADVSGSVAGVASNILTGGSANQTDAGTYAVTADFAPTDATNYNSLTGAAAGNFVINKATPTLSVTNSPVTYDGAAHSADVSGSVAGVVSNILTGGSATKTAAGTYAVTADFAPTDTTNYNSLTGAAAGNFIINKATPTLSVTNSPVTYDGSPQAATVTGSVAGVVSSVKYDGSSTVPTDSNTYAVTANFAPTDTTNYNSLTGAAAGNFIIGKATPTLSVTNSPVTYDGAAHSATVSGSVAGVVSNILTGGLANQTDAGTYAVTADFAPTDTTNYNSLTGAAAGNFIINKATPTLSVTNSPVAYDGAAHAATVTGSVAGVVSNILTGGSATQTNAGTYAVTADFAPTDATNYNSLTGASAGNFIIGKTTPTLSVTNSPVTYDGAAHAATVSGSVAGVVSNILTGGSATQTNVGTYAVTADFVPTDTTNYNSLTGASAGNFIIGKATPTLSVTNSPVMYDGAAHAAAVSGSVAGVVSNILTGGSATQTNIGTYPVTADFAPTDSANYNSLTGASAGNFVISTAVKPPATTLVSPNGTISATTPTYTWNAVSTSTWYLLQVNGPSGTVVYQWYTAAAVGCGSGTGTCSIAPSTTLANGAYTFWVLTYNSAGDGTWSSGMAFTVSAGVVKPPATTLVSPTGTITTGTPTYTWNAVSTSTWYLLQVNGPSGTVIYNWYTAAEVGCAGGTGTCSIAPSVTLPNGAYTFWVLTYNSAGDGTWSSGMAFTVNVGAATLVSPTGLIGTSTPTYTWNAVSTSTWYLLQVNGPSGKVVYNWYTAADAGCGGGTGTCSVTPSTSLTSGAYTWWIMTYTTRDGPWSSGMGFTVP